MEVTHDTQKTTSSSDSQPHATTQSEPMIKDQEYNHLQEAAPKWMWFLDEYVADIKPRILTLDPNDRRVKRKARHLLIELLFSTIDAATDDINDTFQPRRKSATNSQASEDSIDSVVGEMSEDEEDEDTKKMKVLGRIVKAELEELAEAAKEGMEDLI